MSTAAADANDTRVILITGANKGIGLEAAKQLSEQLPNATILMATRSIPNGQTALTKLKQAITANQPQFKYDNIKVLQLDVTDSASIQAAVERVKAEYGRLDVLLNNSGITHINLDHNVFDVMLVNLYAVHDVIEAFAPLIPAGGLILTNTSGVGAWATYNLPAELQKKLTEPEQLTWEQIDALAKDFDLSLRGQPSQHQWPDHSVMVNGMYGMSKALCNAYLRMYAHQHPYSASQGSGVKVAVVTPGYCATDLNKHLGHVGTQPASMGGAAIAWPVLHQSEVKHGGFYHLDGKEYPWVKQQDFRPPPPAQK